MNAANRSLLGGGGGELTTKSRYLKVVPRSLRTLLGTTCIVRYYIANDFWLTLVVDGAIHRAAGPQLLEECMSAFECLVEVVIE